MPKLEDKLFFFWSQEWRRITRAPASLTANVPDPAWLTDPTNVNYVAPALRDPNAVKLLAAYPAPNVAGQRTSTRCRRRTSTTRGRKSSAWTTTCRRSGA